MSAPDEKTLPVLEPWELVDWSEGADLEAKRAAGRDGRGQVPDSFWETYSAMANTEGGVVFLGIEERKADGRFAVAGLGDPGRVRKQLWDGLHNREKVSANLLTEADVREVEMQGRRVLEVHIPRAARGQMPVYLGKNPLGHTFRRRHEGDYRCDDETVKRMLADQVEEARDARLLEHFGFGDLHLPTLTAYRNLFQVVKPDHPFVDLDATEFLRSIGGWMKNRETGREGLTLGGLLMFGKLSSIVDAVPHYVLDYQERPADAEEDADRRWVDRFTTDGSWSGNLFDFYRTVIQRLTRDLKVPFRLKGTTRVDDTRAHEAIREALANTLIHADFTGRMSVYIVKRRDMLGFRNPGLMRVPLPLAVQGGQSDCRNRKLQNMFMLVGLAERAGSGLPKVFRNWKRQHWRRPELLEQIDPEATVLRLRMVSLLPDEAIAELDERFGPDFRQLPENARLALATACVEGSVTHARLKGMLTDHPKDISKMLAHLVERGFLTSRGATRGTTYYLPKRPDKVVEGAHVDKEAGFEHSEPVTEHSEPVTEHSEPVTEHWTAELAQLAHLVRSTDRMPREQVREAILRFTADRFLSRKELSMLIGRAELSLHTHYLRGMIKRGELRLRYPDKPRHRHQAYTSAPPASDD